MTGGGIDRRGPKDSENAHNSFLTKCTEKGFWIFATDIYFMVGLRKKVGIRLSYRYEGRFGHFL